jgi:hypothetical protein
MNFQQIGIGANAGRPGGGIMETKGAQQINEFNLIDDHGKEYTIFEYQEGTEKPSLKWMKTGPSWFSLGDGTPVEKIDDNTFKIATVNGVLHRRG